MGLDWDKIREEYKQKASPEELAGIAPDRPEQPKRTRKSRATGSKNYKSGKQPSWNVEEAMQLWLSGKTVKEVADALGMHNTTIRVQFNKDPRYDPKRDKGGSDPKEVCKRGHKYSEVGYYNSSGGKSCKLCHTLARYLSGLEEARDAVSTVLDGEPKNIAVKAIEELIYATYGDPND